MSARSTPLGTSKPRLHWAVVGVACATIAACGGGSGGAAPPVLLETADGQAGLPAIKATIQDVPTTAAQATAVWIQHDGTQMSVYANRFREGVWHGAVLVEDATGAPNGDAIMVWEQAEAGGGPRSIYAHHYSAAGASWGATPALIDANAGGAQIAMDKRGRATVVWSKQNDAAKINIYASRFE